MAIKIDKNHQRVLEITFWMLDQMLCQFDQWVTRKEVHSILYEEMSTLSEAQCTLIKEEIKEIQMMLKQVRDEIELAKHSENLGRMIHAMSVLFIMDTLTPITGEKMNAYGKTSPELIAYLDPIVTKMISRLTNIAAIARETSS